MSKKLFNQKEIKILSKNINVIKISEKSITYSTEFYGIEYKRDYSS